LPQASAASPWRLVAVPAAITLAVTLLRLVGELLNWSPMLFSRAGGGGGALVGIAWLVPVFAAWFGVRLARAGERPGPLGPAFGLIVLAIALVPLSGIAAAKAGIGQLELRMLFVFAVASLAGVVLAWRAWPALARTLLAYAVAARVPVALIMLLAMLGNWGTHYDAAPPGFPEMGAFAKWLTIGLLPQATVWFWFTIAFGGLFGLVAGAIAGRRGAAA